MNEEVKKRISAKKELLIRTGDRLFSRLGLRRVTVEEICREAGVSKMTFYKHFPNKLELFKQIWTGWSDSIYERLTEMEDKGLPFIERMNALVEFKMELLSRMDRDLIDDILHAGPELQEFILRLKEKSYARFFELVSEAQASGEMRNIKPEFLIAVLMQLGEMAKNDDLRRIYATDIDFFREVNDFFFFGVMPAEKAEEK